MIDETPEITENNSKLNWKDIVTKYKIKSNHKLDEYNKNGFPNVVETFGEAALLGTTMSIAEQKTRKYDPKATKSDFIFFPGVIEEGMRISLIEIPIVELLGIGTLSIRTDSKVFEIIKQAADLTKLPPCVVTINPQTGHWESLDGRSRIRRAREVGAGSIIAYYVPKEYYYSKIIRRG